MVGKANKRRREEEIVEAALVAAGAALAISAIKKFLSLILHRWPSSLLTNPPHFLFLMLNLVIASILVFSVQVQPRKKEQARKKRRRDGAFVKVLDEEKIKEKEQEEGGDVDELNRRAEAFIMAFRHQLRVDSFSSSAHRS
jgi:Cotton fibre expressed protein